MMDGVELMAVSLGLSVAVAALGLVGGRLVERLSADPGLRDRAWGVALSLPLLPPLATGLLLMTPAPVREVVMRGAPLPAILTPVAAATEAAPVTAASPTLDGGLIAMGVIVAAGLLALLRLSVLILRARRLARLMRTGGAMDAALLDDVAAAARDLAVAPPVVVVSATATEPLLAGLRPARLVLPKGLSTADAAVRRAMIAHELAHLKRGDHRALWLEELALALLAVNPLMPPLRARRAAAREEACDAVALGGAGIETRRAYAQSLIEALRTRAGSRTAGALPALTFTGAGRTTAMHRLKAVLNPAAPATRRARIGALMTGVVGLALVGAGSAALAAQRAPVMQEVVQYSATARFEPDAPSATGAAAFIPSSTPVQERAQLSATASFDPDGEMEPRYRNVSAVAYRDFCAGSDVKDKGFCVGVLFGRAIDEEGKTNPRYCPPANLPVAVNETVLPVMARLTPRGDEGAYEYAERVLQQAYPCQTSRTSSAVVAWMPVSFDGNIELKPGDMLHVTLNDANGAMLAESLSTGSDVRIPLTEAEFPRMGQGNRA